MKKQSMIKGSLILGIAGIITKILGAFFRWPVIMLLGDEGVAYYQLPFPMYMLFISFVGGVPIAVSKMVSEAMAKGNDDESFQIMRQAIRFISFLAIGVTLTLLFGAKWIIQFLKWDSKVYYSFMAMAITPCMVASVTVYRGFFQGMQNMYPTAISQVIEQIGRVVAGVGFCYALLPYGLPYAAGGAAIGAGVGGLLGGFYLKLKFIRLKNKMKVQTKFINKTVMDNILKISIPIGLSMLVTSLMSVADSVIIPQKLAQIGFSNKEVAVLFAQFSGKANVLVNLPLSLSVALSASLIPIIAECYYLKRFAELKSKIEAAMKFSFVIAFPSFLGLFFLAKPILELVFPGQSGGYNILKYLSISIPFIIICQTTTSILQACNKLKKPIIFLMIGVFVKVVLTIKLIPFNGLGIYGAIIASIIGYVIPAVCNLICMRNMIRHEFKLASINYYNVMIKPAEASIVMIFCVLISYSYFLSRARGIKVASLISISLGIIIYLLLVVILGVFKYDYIKSRITKR